MSVRAGATRGPLTGRTLPGDRRTARPHPRAATYRRGRAPIRRCLPPSRDQRAAGVRRPGREEFVLMHGGQAYGARRCSAPHTRRRPARAGPRARLGEQGPGCPDPARARLPGARRRRPRGCRPRSPATWRETSEVGADASREAWAAAARERLLEAARRYRATVPPQELAIEVQRRSGIRTRQLWHHWLGEVLGLVGARQLGARGTAAGARCALTTTGGSPTGMPSPCRRPTATPRAPAAPTRPRSGWSATASSTRSACLPTAARCAPPKPVTAPRTATKRASTPRSLR